MFKRFLDFIVGSKESLSHEQIKRRQKLLLIGGCCGLALAFILGFGAFSKTQEKASPSSLPMDKKIDVASDSLDVRDIWADRIERRAEQADKAAQSMEAENKILKKRLETVEDILKKATEGGAFSQKEEEVISSEGLPSQEKVLSQDMSFKESRVSSEFRANTERDEAFALIPQEKKPRILHLSLENKLPLKNVDFYIPAGTYSRAVLTSGVVVSTAQNTQSNPQPIMMRLADSGNLPRGFKSKIKDSVLIGSCYGDLSAERAICRLHSLSYVEEDGTTVEKDIEGWIIGEDGSPGLRGKVVDRAGDAVRQTFIAGLLSGMSNFLRYDAQRGTFPQTPFGQTNALDPTHALRGSVGEGTGNALEKLAQYSIKRAESMQPVIVINPGRVVDVVFKKGIDLYPALDSSAPLKLVSQTKDAVSLGGVEG